MSREVPHRRPELVDGSVRASLPVGSFDWAALGLLANFCNGHGGMPIPWTAIGHTVAGGDTGTFNFYIAPKKPAVERVWVVNLRSNAPTGTTAVVTVGGAGAVTVFPSDIRDARTTHGFRESLAAKTNTVGNAVFTVAPSGGSVVVESVAMFEQTRRTLDATADDLGVDITTLRARSPIADLTFESVAGVIDAYKGLDARRSGYWHWSTDTTAAIAVTAGQGAPLSLFGFPGGGIPMAGPVPTKGDTTVDVTVAALAKVDAGTGTITFASDDAGDTTTISITQNTYGAPTWGTATLTINAEDLTIVDGRRGNSWEGVTVTGHVTAANQLDIQALSIIRSTTPL